MSTVLIVVFVSLERDMESSKARPKLVGGLEGAMVLSRWTPRRTCSLLRPVICMVSLKKGRRRSLEGRHGKLARRQQRRREQGDEREPEKVYRFRQLERSQL